MVPIVGFVGGGRIARILLAGWLHSGKTFQEVRVCDPDSSAIERLKFFGTSIVKSATPEEVAKSPVVFLAVHPPVMEKVCRELAVHLTHETVVVSLAPKITFTRLREWLGGHSALARAIPNAGSYVGKGFTPVCIEASLAEKQREEVLGLFGSVGTVVTVNEEVLEVYAIVTGMGPTYFWPQLFELRSFLRETGLPDNAIRVALGEMLQGALSVMFESGLSEEQIMDLIPVKPLADIEPSLRESYHTRLREFLVKLRPQ